MRITPIIYAIIASIVLSVQPVAATDHKQPDLSASAPEEATKWPLNRKDGQNGLQTAETTTIPGNHLGHRPTQSRREVVHLPKRGEIVSLEHIKEICAHFGLSALWAKITRDPPDLPFKSDGCSLWFNKWRGYDLYPACFRHDLKYWAGYPGEEIERLAADSELMIEVARIMGSTKMAETMFTGVRLGGSEWTKASFAWGFGRKLKTK
jgi:hypothetical protein